MKSGSGFTLLELLVVVAILAILAAIAIPNLLEAQVRTKVSRTRADMRSMATALEVYTADHGRYPSYHYPRIAPDSPSAEFFMGGETGPAIFMERPFDGNPQLTTPIAYIASLPTDLFFAQDGEVQAERVQHMYVNWRYAGEKRVLDVPLFFELAVRFFGDWHLMSGGPSRSRALLPHGSNHYDSFYDPTNGTVGPGMIYRTALDPTGRPIGI